MYSIGIDIGGMSVKIGLVNEVGKIIYQSSFKTSKDSEKVVKNISEHINKILLDNNIKKDEVKGIGIGCPGAVNNENGIIDFLPNLDWENIEIVKMLKKYLDMPIKISNDANLAALGEALYGCAKKYKTCIMFTLGTGVGGGIIIDKKLFEGGYSRGAELGHTTLFLNGEDCTCGRKGCVECYTSATALIKQTKKEMINNKDSIMWEFVDNDIEKVDGRTAFECSKKGDVSANKVVDNYVYYLAESMLNMFNIFRPEAFIIGGGISAQGDYLIKKLKAYCEKAEYGYKRAPKTEILVASLGNDAGIIGAASLFKS